MPVEIIAFKISVDGTECSDIETFTGTDKEVSDLRRHFFTSWKEHFSIEPTIVYRGQKMKEALESIQDIPRISDEASR